MNGVVGVRTLYAGTQHTWRNVCLTDATHGASGPRVLAQQVEGITSFVRTKLDHIEQR